LQPACPKQPLLFETITSYAGVFVGLACIIFIMTSDEPSIDEFEAELDLERSKGVANEEEQAAGTDRNTYCKHVLTTNAEIGAAQVT
jgi:hypothetical protein